MSSKSGPNQQQQKILHRDSLPNKKKPFLGRFFHRMLDLTSGSNRFPSLHQLCSALFRSESENLCYLFMRSFTPLLFLKQPLFLSRVSLIQADRYSRSTSLHMAFEWERSRCLIWYATIG
jgi:hypothetical protein